MCWKHYTINNHVQLRLIIDKNYWCHMYTICVVWWTASKISSRYCAKWLFLTPCSKINNGPQPHTRLRTHLNQFQQVQIDYVYIWQKWTCFSQFCSIPHPLPSCWTNQTTLPFLSPIDQQTFNLLRPMDLTKGTGDLGRPLEVVTKVFVDCSIFKHGHMVFAHLYRRWKSSWTKQCLLTYSGWKSSKFFAHCAPSDDFPSQYGVVQNWLFTSGMRS